MDNQTDTHEPLSKMNMAVGQRSGAPWMTGEKEQIPQGKSTFHALQGEVFTIIPYGGMHGHHGSEPDTSLRAGVGHLTLDVR